MKNVPFEDRELPYATLAKYGLTQEMIEDLPMAVLDDINAGNRSPVLPVSITDDAGETITTRTRFAFVRMDSGNVEVMFYPVLGSSPLEKYSETQQKQLLAGKAIVAEIELTDGRHSQDFVQIDKETKQVMSAPTQVIGRNLQVLTEEFRLGAPEIKAMQNGEPVTLVVEDEPMTVGIDLNESTGIRFCQGDEQKWKEQSKREWDKYNFGCFGCWVQDENGNLDYVSEDDYTEELWNEQKKQGERNRTAGVSMHK